VKVFDAAKWWKDRDGISTVPSRATSQADETPSLHNPYEGCPYAWQLTETVDEFLARLPPATTDCDAETPWIYICNPYIPRKHRTRSQNQKSRGNEDEAPEEEGSRLDIFIEGGMERLHLLKELLENVKKARMTKSATTREINEGKAVAVKDILNLAHDCHVRAGKVCSLARLSRSGG
jgi:hypothetical protein